MNIYGVNKYGAVDVEEIAKIADTIQDLIKEIRGIREEIGRQDGWFDYCMRGHCGMTSFGCYTPILDRVNKIEDIVKANGYYYKTETKLIKKAKKK